ACLFEFFSNVLRGFAVLRRSSHMGRLGQSAQMLLRTRRVGHGNEFLVPLVLLGKIAKSKSLWSGRAAGILLSKSKKCEKYKRKNEFGQFQSSLLSRSTE